MTTPSDGEQDKQWEQPGPPDPPAAPPGPPPAYGQPSSPSYGKYGQGQAEPVEQQPGPGQPAWGQPGSGDPAWGQPGYGQPGFGQPPRYSGQAPWLAGPGAFQPSGGLGLAVIVLSIAVAAAYWIAALLAPSADRAYGAAVASGRPVSDVLTGYDAVSGISILIMIGTWGVTSLWLGRARENALRLNPQGQRRSTVWVWIGWIVPVVSLWFPKQILDDTISATAPAAGERSPIRTGPFWATWIVMLVLNNAEVQLSLTAAPEDKINPGLEIAVAVAVSVAVVFWIMLVRRISAIQDKLAAGAK
jgi:hypothetical protein